MISCMPLTVDRNEAQAIIAGVSGDVSVAVEERVFYPYHRVLFRYSARTPLGESSLKVLCLVDGRTGVASTTDPFDIGEAEPAADEVIADAIDRAEARGIAERYVGYVVRNKRKALVGPKTEVLEQDLVHKPFWIVRCSNRTKPPFRVLVDGVTGGFYVMASDEIDAGTL